MATIMQRITLLEQQANQGEESYFLVICKGNGPTPKQEAEAAQHKRVILVTFPNSEGMLYGNN